MTTPAPRGPARIATPVPGGGTYIRRPRTSPAGFTALQVAGAYNYPAATGKGRTGGIIELGGGFGQADLTAYFGALGLPVPHVVAKPVAGGSNTSDGPDGADGEVLLDIEVAGAIAPAATFNVYFAPNTDEGFIAAIGQAAADDVDAISISWGGAENSWAAASVTGMEAALSAARAKGIQVFVASGDSGSGDGEAGRNVDYPASSPSACGCGGTSLTLNAAGQRVTEVVWDDNPASSAGGGGASVLFPGRDVPDVAGNADPETGYRVTVDGENAVFGGTSAVAPLHLGLYLRLLELTGRRFDFVATVAAHATVCFDVTSGNNGAYRAGPGRDEDTGFGVVDGTKLLAVVQAAPVVPPPAPVPVPVPVPAIHVDAADRALATGLPGGWPAEHHVGSNAEAAAAVERWLQAKGLTAG
jgi:kumamolisin